ncbi:hypothetical protein [uncultured Jatrophihabitans sp.]|uniref:hypothetical protein n=1 Tax=uncultured Jatrophihabitans sp. TaxID=1610747 RepID=UPI0035CA8040
MAASRHRAFQSVGEFLRVMGAALTGFMPPMRAPDGTYGTQRMTGRRLAEERQRKYPQG